MDAAGLRISLLLVLTTPALAALGPLYFVNTLKNWSEAQRYCREELDDLVTIENGDEWARITDMIADFGQADAWIGLFGGSGWRWSLDSTLLFEQYTGSQFNFYADSTSGDCAAILSQKLNVVSCILERPSLCYDGASGSFTRVSTRQTWQTSLDYCRETYTDLASITSEQQFNTLMSMVESSSQSGLFHWVGLSRETPWRWSDNSVASYRVWATGEPNSVSPACTGVAADGWFADSCGVERPFICAATWHGTVLKVKLETDGLVNMTDPLVQDAVLKQMDKDLRERGISQQFRLRWRKQPNGDILRSTEP